MIIFKTYLKILNKNKWIVILYTAILVFFGIFNMKTTETTSTFTEQKPNITISNLDGETRITQNLIQYLQEKCHVKELKETVSIKDALFYREIDYFITIPAHYEEEFLNHQNPSLKIENTGNYQASLAETILVHYLKIADTYNEFLLSKEEKLTKINETLQLETDITLTTKKDTSAFAKSTAFYNFANYSILAGNIYIICMILASFKNEKVEKRTRISSLKMETLNRHLLLASGIFTWVLCSLYIMISFCLLKESMKSIYGLLYILNCFNFSFCALSIAFLIGSLVKQKEAINGIVNVIALGSSFLCGAFVPLEFLPSFVLKIHLYIDNKN